MSVSSKLQLILYVEGGPTLRFETAVDWPTSRSAKSAKETVDNEKILHQTHTLNSHMGRNTHLW